MLDEYITDKLNEAQNFIQIDGEKALKIYGEILEIDPENIDALNGIGSAHIKLNNFDEAEKFFDKSLSICENSSALLNKGIICKYKNNTKKAIYYYDKACEIDSNLKNIINMLKDELISKEINFNDKANKVIKQGISMKKQNRLWDSLDSFEQAIKLDPSCKSEVDKLINDTKEILSQKLAYADEEYESANKIDRIKMQALNALVNDKDYEKASTLIDISLELDENDLNILNHKGRLLFAKSDYHGAIKYFDACLKIDKTYYYALFNKAFTLRTINELIISLKCFNELSKTEQFSHKVKPYQKEILEKINQPL